MIFNMQPDFSNINSEAINIAIVGYGIVFSALIILFFSFTILPKIVNLKKPIRKKEVEQQIKLNQLQKASNSDQEVNAAIAMALHLYFNDLHDEESGIITFNTNGTSPWSSKAEVIRNSQLSK